MSFAGSRLTFAQREPRKVREGGSDSIAVARKQARKEFARFQKARKTKSARAGIAQQERALNTCTCGQHKRQSATYCEDCTDERLVLRRKFKAAVLDNRSGATTKFKKMSDAVVEHRRVCAPLHYKSIAATDYSNSFLDELVNICEENLSKLD